jgi:hypothetical protein
VVLELLVDLVVVVVVEVLLVHNTRVDKLGHRMMDMVQHKLLVISYLSLVEFLPNRHRRLQRIRSI